MFYSFWHMTFLLMETQLESEIILKLSEIIYYLEFLKHGEY